MTQALIGIQRVLSEANAAGKLTDTIWRGPAETLFDYIQNEIDAAGTTGCTDQHQIAEPQKFTVDSGMSRSFEIEYGQDWKDPDWRRETGVWASAWHKATNAARAAAPQAVQPAVPQGWKPGLLITEEMHAAACKVLFRAHGLEGTPQRMLDAMLSAARGIGATHGQ